MERVRMLAQRRLQTLLMPPVRLLVRLQISPNQITVAGLLLALTASWLVVLGWHVTAGIVFLFASSLDLLDGLLARTAQKVTDFGAFLDSALDRVGEGTMFAAIAYYFASQGQASAVSIVVLAMLGGMLTSYTRARAETLGLSCKGGVASRPERVLMITAGLVLGILLEAIYILAVLSLWTAGQRIVRVYQSLPVSR
nr:CDP-alcohol phosphatidyltransferase family protein [Gammaproteobacteria bacterium]